MAWYTPIAKFVNKIPGAHAAASGAIRAVDEEDPFGSPGATLGKNIANPNVNYLGQQNPSSGHGGGGASMAGDLMASGGGTGGGAAGKSGGSGGSSANNAAGGSNTFLPLFNSAVGNLQNAYNGLFGQNGGGGGSFDQAAGQAAANIQGGYQSQQNTLGSQFGQAQNQMPWELAGRGAGSSSWADNNIGYAQNQYNSSLQGIQSNEQKDLAGVAQQEAGIKNQYGGFLSAFNDPKYQAMLGQAPAYIQSEAYSNALTDLANAQYTQGANTPMSQAIGNLQQNPSYQQAGGANIQNALSALAGSPTTSAAQNQIAQGIIGNPTNPGNPDIYQNQYAQLTAPKTSG